MLLAEAGANVILCEAAPEAGGKAKSARRADGNPTEHSLRIYLDHYQTLLTLLSRIPTESGHTVLDNLVGISAVRVTAQSVIGEAKPPVPLSGCGRQSILRRLARAVFDPFRQAGRVAIRSGMVFVGLGRRGVSRRDVAAYIYAHLRLLWMCEDRVRAELSGISYGDYLGLSRRSHQAQAFFSALPRIFVAARASAEAAAIGPIILKALYHLTCRPLGLDGVRLTPTMMMNGPTSERMIDPWIRRLEALGVDIRYNTQVIDLSFANGRISSILCEDGLELPCDYAILAVPYLALRRLACHDHVRRHLPHLAGEHRIQLESSNGMQCYLRELPAAWPPHLRPGVGVSFLESPWSLVAVVQGSGFWHNVSLPERTAYVLSMTWSEVEKPGSVFSKPLGDCTPEEIFMECMAQCGLEQDAVIAWQIDRELVFIGETAYASVSDKLAPHLAFPAHRGQRLLNFSPLTVLLPGARNHSPQIRTEVPNLFLAGEATYAPELTLFVPTMEKAASAGYISAMAIMRSVNPEAAQRIQIDIRDPFPFRILRRLDRWQWNRRLQSEPSSPEPSPESS
jgi:uncharacterized protein with NAD-binding domain and iron-sulfur cluster